MAFLIIDLIPEIESSLKKSQTDLSLEVNQVIGKLNYFRC